MTWICIFTPFAARLISNHSECGRLRRNIHSWFLFTSGSFISWRILSGVWHWNGCVLNTEKGDLCVHRRVFFFFFCSHFGANQKWWMAWRFNDLVAERQVLKQAHYMLTAGRWRSTSARSLQHSHEKPPPQLKEWSAEKRDKGEGSPPTPPYKTTQTLPRDYTSHLFFLFFIKKHALAAEFGTSLPLPKGLSLSANSLTHTYIYIPFLGN